VSGAAISKACKARRLDRSVARDERGRVVDIDPEEGRREWLNALPPKHVAALEARGSVEAAVHAARRRPAVGVEEVRGRLSALIAEAMDEERDIVVRLVPAFLEGAIEGLQRAGREPTAATLTDALGLGPDNEDAGVDHLVELHAIVEGGPGVGGGLSDDLARQAGRDAVLETKGGGDGDR
jgi:hypothetical protein